jgi:predicted O-methyltransferase YrrM
VFRLKQFNISWETANYFDNPSWFSTTAENHFTKYLQSYRDKPNLTFVQLGAFAGDASLWLLNNVLTNKNSFLHDIDTWEGSDEHNVLDMDFIETVYDARVNEFTNVKKYKETTQMFFASNYLQTADFVYVDASHQYDDVIYDAEESWKILKTNGILAFDDYTWNDAGQPHAPTRKAINKFLKDYTNQYKLLERSNQVWVQKL